MPQDCGAEEEPPKGTSNKASDCCVCLEELNSGLAALSCGHVLHVVCVRMLLAKTRRKTCPQCRTPFTTVVPLFFHIPSGFECKESQLEGERLSFSNCERIMMADPMDSRHGSNDSVEDETLLSFLNARLGDVEAQLSDAHVQINRHETTIASLRNQRREATLLALKLDEKAGECVLLQRELDRLREASREEAKTLRVELRRQEIAAAKAQQCEKQLLEELETLKSLRLAADVRQVAEEMDSSQARGWYERVEDISEARGLLLALDTQCRGIDRELERARMEYRRLEIKTERLEKSLLKLQRMNRKENREITVKHDKDQHQGSAMLTTSLDSILLGDSADMSTPMKPHSDLGASAGSDASVSVSYSKRLTLPQPQPQPQPPPLTMLKRAKQTNGKGNDYGSDGRGGQARVFQLRNGDRIHL